MSTARRSPALSPGRIGKEGRAVECDEVMLTVRITTAERTLLRRLAQGHRSDVSEVVADGLVDVLPSFLGVDAGRLTEVAAFAPCAQTVWLPTALADLLVPVSNRITQLTGIRLGSSCAVLGAAVRLWLGQDPQRLAACLRSMHEGCPAPVPCAA